MTTRKHKWEYRSPFDFDMTKMTVEEVEERLRASGIDPGKWTDNEDYVKAGDKANLPTLSWYAEMLKEMGVILEEQVKRDLQETDELNYQLMRLKRGGGR
jgi:hypothetical protein